MMVLNERLTAHVTSLRTIGEQHDELLFAFLKGAAVAHIHVTAHGDAAEKWDLGYPEDEAWSKNIFTVIIMRHHGNCEHDSIAKYWYQVDNEVDAHGGFTGCTLLLLVFILVLGHLMHHFPEPQQTIDEDNCLNSNQEALAHSKSKVVYYYARDGPCCNHKVISGTQDTSGYIDTPLTLLIKVFLTLSRSWQFLEV